MRSVTKNCFQSYATYDVRCKECKRKRDGAISSGVADKELPEDFIYFEKLLGDSTKDIEPRPEV